MQYWLIKSEPEAFSLDDFRREQVTIWNGVRNYTARNNLKAMQIGDICLFYRSVTKPAAIGLARVVREFYPDETADDGKDWVAVDMALHEEFSHEVSLATIKATPELGNMILLKQSRLSVQPVLPEEFDLICRMGRGKM